MARRVHKIELIGLAIFGGIVQAHGLRLDGDPALLFDVHVIKDLRAHLPVGQAAGALDQAIGQRRLAMVDMRNDRKVSDMGQVGHRRPIAAVAGAVSRITLCMAREIAVR